MNPASSSLGNVPREARPFWILWMVIFFFATCYGLWLGFQEGFELKIMIPILVHASISVFLGVAIWRMQYNKLLFLFLCWAVVLLAIFFR